MEKDSKIDVGEKMEVNAKTGGAGTGGGAGAGGVSGGGAAGGGIGVGAAPAAAPQPSHPPQPYSPYYPYYTYTGPYYYPTYPTTLPPRKGRSSKPDAVGALLVIAGVLSIIMGLTAGLFFVGIGGFMTNMDNMMGDTGDVSGHVIAQNSTPLEGATLTVVDSGQQVISNPTGYYRIVGVDTGWHDIRIEKQGYRTIIQSVNVLPSSNSNMDYGNFDDGHSEHEDSTVVDFQLQPGTDTYRVGGQHKGDWNTPWGDWSNSWSGVFIGVCSLLMMLFGFLTLIGGFFAFRRKHLPVVFMGAVFGIISIGFFLGIILSILALIILFLCMDEFNGHKKGSEGGKAKKAAKKDFEEV